MNRLGCSGNAQNVAQLILPSVRCVAASQTEGPVQVETLTTVDVASAVELAVRVLRVKPGDRGEQFASDITDDRRQMFVAKANGQVVAYGRVIELAADEVFYMTGADNLASLHLHAALGFQEMRRFGSDRSAAGVDVLSQLARTAERS
jgi:hypothetical protein